MVGSLPLEKERKHQWALIGDQRGNIQLPRIRNNSGDFIRADIPYKWLRFTLNCCNSQGDAMESAKQVARNLDSAKVLACGSTHGHRVELLEFPDGSFVVNCDGEEQMVYQAGTCNLESCIKGYMGFLRSWREAGRNELEVGS
jgi:hypothetical protein